MRTFLRTSLAALALASALPVPANDGTAGAPVSGDAEAIAVLSAVNDHEVQAARIAKGKQIDPEVMAYADKMSREHGTNQRETEQLKQAASLVASETDAVRALKQKSDAERAKLAAIDGKAFQAAYMDAMVKDHAEVLNKLDKELLPAAKDPAIAAHLRKTREHVAHHLEEARRIDGQLQAQADADD
jgi:putative membrane protein